ncbi:16S rRNA (cytosine(967)-C(5))-methyltransferase RsmB [Chungangia koreensis]|uniref:16S rRNA (cytosine(967)-C(5))-methyltransferase n=1 Tax=Chungangia koreensis TaxID=752657 RepID=A0ABV8X1T7_9LACT
MSKNSTRGNGNVREAALSILMAVEKNQAYSNLLLHNTIEKHGINPKDRSLLTEITYGTLQHKMTLDYYLKPFLRGKIEDWVKQLLRISLYQLLYLSRVPAHAVVNEAVEIAKRRGHKGISSMVNGVLRSIQRQGVRSLDDIADPIERLAIETSHPLWMIKDWIKEYGFEKTREMAFENNRAPVQTVRVNTFKTTIESVVEKLEEDGLKVERSETVPECLYVTNGQAVRTTAFKEGLITIQDESSMFPAHALKVEPGMRVLDMCAAPGGKSTHIAEKMENKGEIISLDLHEHKVKLIRENAERLGLSIIQAETADGRKAGEQFKTESFDRILVDAPCSGLGVIRRKPDIKYTKTEQDAKSLQKIQLDLLDEAYTLLKPGGILVYSTCTVEPTENREVSSQFMEKHPDMQAVDELSPLFPQKGMIQVLPQDFGSDGFFVAAFEKQ